MSGLPIIQYAVQNYVPTSENLDKARQRCYLNLRDTEIVRVIQVTDQIKVSKVQSFIGSICSQGGLQG